MSNIIAPAAIPAPWKQGTFTAEQLQGMAFPPVSWIVPDIIPAEGVALLCSKPKFGKSWLAYDLCIACTMDRFTLGTIKPAQGEVLYLALEDSRRRLQRRMRKLLPASDTKWPSKLTLKTDWRRLHEGGLADIHAWHTETVNHSGKPILVVIDVLAKVRKPSGNKPLYEADYEAITGLAKLANEIGIAIVVIHHTRKMAADDLMETVSGSFGITGAVDTVLVMASKASGAVLDVRGRDVEPAEKAIAFNKATCRWTILGDSAEIHVSDQRAKIIAALRDADAPTTVTALVVATEMKRNPLEVLLGRMVKDQTIQRIKAGLYAHKDYVQPPPPDKPTKTSPIRSVSSVSAEQPTRQIKEPLQHTGNKENQDAICPSVRSVCKSAGRPPLEEALHSRLGAVRTRTDRTDKQTETQAIERITLSNAGDMSDRQTDRTDLKPGQTFARVTIREIRHPAISAGPHDDLGDFA
jgi:hypothetical protein